MKRDRRERCVWGREDRGCVDELEAIIVNALHAQELIRGSVEDGVAVVDGFLDINELATVLTNQFQLMPHATTGPPPLHWTKTAENRPKPGVS
ncbi:hypothetical protein [Nocardia suismassiliense]|uniref:hypothetical protein n=1 Tax=Nocardia suismassiliense TaxID=2077092 RepID=UPI000D1F861E|nr:hypothetical protein [Nocardia suismassiliense]